MPAGIKRAVYWQSLVAEGTDMAKVTLNPILDDIRGKIGDYVLRRAPSGKLILSKAPDMSRVKWSKTQKENRQCFKEATAYAKAAMAEPYVRARY